jgi:benzoate membrane transport protein
VKRFLADLSLPAAVAGFVAVLVGFTSSVVIVFAAAKALGATPAQASSWIWALGIGMAATSIGLSWWTKQPVLTAWSTPGAALVAGTSGVPMDVAVGAFVACGVLIVLAGVTRAFERVMDRIPQAIAAALLAGVLARFGLDAAGAAASAPVLVIAMALAFLAGRRAWPRYAVPGVLAVGIAVAALQGRMQWQQLSLDAAWPVWTTPVFSASAFVGLALPLFVVTMASQNLPGVAAQRAAGYATPVSVSITATGAATALLAPFGGFAFNLAAITAAICMGREAGEDPGKRWTAAAMAGVFYLAIGLAGGAVVGLLQAFPRELVLAVAGLTLAGIGSAFWGVVAGAAALVVQQWRPRGAS